MIYRFVLIQSCLENRLPSPSPLGLPRELIITSPLAKQCVVCRKPSPVFWATSSGEIICHKTKIAIINWSWHFEILIIAEMFKMTNFELYKNWNNNDRTYKCSHWNNSVIVEGFEPSFSFFGQFQRGKIEASVGLPRVSINGYHQ